MEGKMKTGKIILAIALFIAILLFLGTCVTTETPLPDVAGETWDYVILGSSIGTWWTPFYSTSLRNDLGVKLSNHTYFVPYQSAYGLLENIRNNEGLREDIRQAEVITIGVGSGDMLDAITKFGAGCQNDGTRLTEELNRFRETYVSMLTELLSLTSPTDTLIRTMDFYYPYVGRDQEKGTYNENKRYWQEFNKCIIQASQNCGIPVAKVFEAFNGPHGNDDPAKKGYLAGAGTGNGLHSSQEGMKVIAEEFRKLGYGYASP
jgi:lysophospholipase L1-like esterase